VPVDDDGFTILLYPVHGKNSWLVTWNKKNCDNFPSKIQMIKGTEVKEIEIGYWNIDWILVVVIVEEDDDVLGLEGGLDEDPTDSFIPMIWEMVGKLIKSNTKMTFKETSQTNNCLVQSWTKIDVNWEIVINCDVDGWIFEKSSAEWDEILRKVEDEKIYFFQKFKIR